MRPTLSSPLTPRAVSARRRRQRQRREGSPTDSPGARSGSHSGGFSPHSTPTRGGAGQQASGSRRGQLTASQTELFRALQLRNEKRVEDLAKTGVKVSFVGPGGETPLVLAVRIQSHPAVNALLAAGADPNQRTAAGGLALCEVCVCVGVCMCVCGCGCVGVCLLVVVHPRSVASSAKAHSPCVCSFRTAPVRLRLCPPFLAVHPLSASVVACVRGVVPVLAWLLPCCFVLWCWAVVARRR